MCTFTSKLYGTVSGTVYGSFSKFRLKSVRKISSVEALFCSILFVLMLGRQLVVLFCPTFVIPLLCYLATYIYLEFFDLEKHLSNNHQSLLQRYRQSPLRSWLTSVVLKCQPAGMFSRPRIRHQSTIGDLPFSFFVVR